MTIEDVKKQVKKDEQEKLNTSLNEFYKIEKKELQRYEKNNNNNINVF